MNRRQFIGTTLGAGLALATHAAADERRLRVAVIGHTGRGNYGHDIDTVWLTLPEVELVAVADADAKGLAAAQKRLKLAQGFADYRAMLAEIKPDLVAIAPRFADEHRDMALAAIAAGARGIYCEKPFCRSPAEADAIVTACEKHGVKFAVAHRNRYHPALAAADWLIKDGAIGRLLKAEPALTALDVDLKHLFTHWFNRGFLRLERIGWQTPAAVLEKLIRYESVHEVNGWPDLRRRLQRAGVTIGEVDHVRHAGLRHHGQHAAAFGQRRSHRLLGEDRQPPARHGDGNLGMRGIGCDIDHAIEFLRRQHLAIVAVDSGDGMARGKLPRPLGHHVAACRDLYAGDLAKLLRMAVRHAACAHNAQPDHRLPPCDDPSSNTAISVS